MHGLWSLAFSWWAEVGGKEGLSYDENIQCGQMWVQPYWEYRKPFKRGLKGGKEKYSIYLVIYSLNKYLFSVYLS